MPKDLPAPLAPNMFGNPVGKEEGQAPRPPRPPRPPPSSAPMRVCRYGKYLYYYAPSSALREVKYSPGWCLSDFLGDGHTAFRLPLGPLDGGPGLEGSDGSEAERSWKAYVKYKLHAAKYKLHAHRRQKQDTWSLDVEGLPNPLQALAGDAVGATTPVQGCSFISVASTASHATTAAEVVEVPVLSGDDVGLRTVPQVASLLHFAVASGDEPTIRAVLQAYKDRHPQCLRWQYHVGHGLWHTYAPSVQRQIAHALARRLPGVALEHGPVLDLDRLEHRAGRAAQPMRCHLQTQLQWRVEDARWRVTSAPEDVPDWEGVFVTMVSGSLALAAPDEATLVLLATEGVADPTLWRPASKHNAVALAVPHGCEQWFLRSLAAFVGSAFEGSEAPGLPVTVSRQGYMRERRAGGRDAAVPEWSRFSDGLAAPDSGAPRSTFYDAKYRSAVGTLAFSMALPDNTLGLQFLPGPIAEMCVESVVKVHELQRQRVTLSPLHVVPIYVYTYELADDGDQIYSAMNRAMRLHDEAAIEFWRPLIWQVLQRGRD